MRSFSRLEILRGSCRRERGVESPETTFSTTLAAELEFSEPDVLQVVCGLGIPWGRGLLRTCGSAGYLELLVAAFAAPFHMILSRLQSSPAVTLVLDQLYCRNRRAQATGSALDMKESCWRNFFHVPCGRGRNASMGSSLGIAIHGSITSGALWLSWPILVVNDGDTAGDDVEMYTSSWDRIV